MGGVIARPIAAQHAGAADGSGIFARWTALARGRPWRYAAQDDAMTLQRAQQLRAAGRHEEAREVLTALARSQPADAVVQYEAACVHDFLGLEAEAVPLYLAALNGELPAPLRRGAYAGLGSTYRTLGLFQRAHDTLVQGLAEFPQASELRVFLAMACYNLGEHKSAVESLLQILASTTSDPDLKAYSRAIELYAQDINRTWPSGAATTPRSS